MTTYSSTLDDDGHAGISPTRTGAISVALILHVSAFALLLAPVQRADFSLAPTVPRTEVLMPERVREIPLPPIVPITPPALRTPRVLNNTAVQTAPIDNPLPAVSMDQVISAVTPQPPGLVTSVGAGNGELFAPELIGSASYLTAPPPRYPARELRRGAEGEVLLIVTIAANGLPESVAVQQSSGFEALDRAALEQVQRRWRFRPLLVDGRATRSRALVPIRFSLDRG